MVIFARFMGSGISSFNQDILVNKNPQKEYLLEVTSMRHQYLSQFEQVILVNINKLSW